jgi:hypothetical protein
MEAIQFEVCQDSDRWDAFVASSPQGHVFCTTAFLDAMPLEYDLIVMREGADVIMGAIALRRGTELLPSPYPMTMYQGILCGRSYQELPFHARSKWLLDRLSPFLAELERRYSRLSFCLSHAFDDLRPLQWFHYHEPELGQFKLTLRYTALLALDAVADFEACLALVRTVRRQEYRKATGLGFTAEPSTDLALLDQLHRETFERQGITRPHDESQLLIAIAGAALAKGFGELFVCRDKAGSPAAATLFLYDRRYGYYLVGANKPEYRKSGAGSFLLLENIRRCQQKGLSAVDFVGVNSPNRGDFKSSFNARLAPYYVVDL